MNRDEYIAMVEKWTRPQLLKVCRAGGITAHKLRTNRALAELLWNSFGKQANEKTA
jgi:hypothetical protein